MTNAPAAFPSRDEDPIVVVSGLPRSGTSLMMQMLAAGGMELVTDDQRQPDIDNPRGYFEDERVKALANDSAWLTAARGKAIKVISALLPHLPRTHRYQILFMRRSLDEVLASQAKMLGHRGVTRSEDPRLRNELEAHLAVIDRLLARDPAFAVCDVSYHGLIVAADEEIARIVAFLGRELDMAAMRVSIEPALYRNRADSQVPEIP